MNFIPQIGRLLFLWMALTLSTNINAQVVFNLREGWNLLGNGGSAPVVVTTTFSDPGKVSTVWKWNGSTNRWAFYSPSMTSTALATYAHDKGYDVLSVINPKEGFWVNASASATLTGPVSSAVTLVEGDLSSGWNLVGNADNKTPSQLIQSLN